MNHAHRRTFPLIVLMMLFSAPRIAEPQGTEGSTGISCADAAISAEKLICSDRDLIALDQEYSRVVANELPDRTKDLLQSRDKCVDDGADSTVLRSMQLQCVQNWYYGRIAELSDTPKTPPSEWTPRLIAGVSVYIRRQNLVADVYARAASTEKFFKMRFEKGQPQPARLDKSVLYYVYRNVLGRLNYVQEYRNEGHLDLAYFFNKDGRLTAETRHADQKVGNVVYVETESVFYDSAGRETSRTRTAFENGRIVASREKSPIPRLEKPAFNSFAGFFNERFSSARGLDADQLGLCYVSLSDGYGPQTRVLNLAAEPLSYYQHTIPAVNYSNMDKPQSSEGTVRQLGTLIGMRVYVVEYSVSFHVILVERARDRFLPVLIVSPDEPIDDLEIQKVEGQDLLVYSSTISGNAHYVDDWYFIVERGIPRRIQYDTVLQSELKKIRPESVIVPNRSGRFDPKTLTYREYVAPWGNYVEVVFGLRNGAFYVKSSLYHKED
jgi:uncharacterized protein